MFFCGLLLMDVGLNPKPSPEKLDETVQYEIRKALKFRKHLCIKTLRFEIACFYTLPDFLHDCFYKPNQILWFPF